MLEIVDKIKNKGAYIKSLKDKKAEMVMALYDSGMKIVDIVRNTELSRSTVNRIVKNHNSKADIA